jgi:membrane protein CcdC involved in cytochrome C biogenesis
MLLSVPLIWTTNYEIREDRAIYMKKNAAFIFAFLIVVIVRFALRAELSVLAPEARVTLFLALACGYIIPWRIISFLKFRKVYEQRTMLG